MRAQVPVLVIVMGLSSCTAASPSDDHRDWEVDTSVEYRLEVSPPTWVVPSIGLPAREPSIRESNNNLDRELFEGRRYLAWRTNVNHWAGPDVKLHVISTEGDSTTWDFELTVAIGTDIREPRFVAIGGRLFLYYFEGGTNFAA